MNSPRTPPVGPRAMPCSGSQPRKSVVNPDKVSTGHRQVMTDRANALAESAAGHRPPLTAHSAQVKRKEDADEPARSGSVWTSRLHPTFDQVRYSRDQ